MNNNNSHNSKLIFNSSLLMGATTLGLPTTINATIGHRPFLLWQEIVIWLLVGILCLVTVIGNIMVILAFLREPSIRQPNNYCIVSLAASDLLIGLFSMPFYTLYLLLDFWPLGPLLCDLWLTTDYTACLVSQYTVLLITIDRFCSVRIPAKYRIWRTKAKLKFLICFVWILSFGIFFTSIVGWPLITGKRTRGLHECYVPFRNNKIFNTALIFAYFWVSLVILLILYYGIYRVAYTMAKKSDNRKLKSTLLKGNQIIFTTAKTAFPIHGMSGATDKKRSSDEERRYEKQTEKLTRLLGKPEDIDTDDHKDDFDNDDDDTEIGHKPSLPKKVVHRSFLEPISESHPLNKPTSSNKLTSVLKNVAQSSIGINKNGKTRDNNLPNLTGLKSVHAKHIRFKSLAPIINSKKSNNKFKTKLETPSREDYRDLNDNQKNHESMNEFIDCTSKAKILTNDKINEVVEGKTSNIMTDSTLNITDEAEIANKENDKNIFKSLETPGHKSFISTQRPTNTNSFFSDKITQQRNLQISNPQTSSVSQIPNSGIKNSSTDRKIINQVGQPLIPREKKRRALPNPHLLRKFSHKLLHETNKKNYRIPKTSSFGMDFPYPYDDDMLNNVLQDKKHTEANTLRNERSIAHSCGLNPLNIEFKPFSYFPYAYEPPYGNDQMHEEIDRDELIDLQKNNLNSFSDRSQINNAFTNIRNSFDFNTQLKATTGYHSNRDILKNASNCQSLLIVPNNTLLDKNTSSLSYNIHDQNDKRGDHPKEVVTQNSNQSEDKPISSENNKYMTEKEKAKENLITDKSTWIRTSSKKLLPALPDVKSLSKNFKPTRSVKIKISNKKIKPNYQEISYDEDLADEIADAQDEGKSESINGTDLLNDQLSESTNEKTNFDNTANNDSLDAKEKSSDVPDPSKSQQKGSTIKHSTSTSSSSSKLGSLKLGTSAISSIWPGGGLKSNMYTAAKTKALISAAKKRKKNTKAKKALRTITCIMGAFVLCWTPYHILETIWGFCDSCYINPHFYAFTYWLCYLNSPLNPFMYALANVHFKQAFIKLLNCRNYS